MSWFKIFSAVVVGNIVSWIIVSLIGLLFWAFFFNSLGNALADRGFSSTPSSKLLEMRKMDKDLADRYNDTVNSVVQNTLTRPPQPEPKKRVFSDSAIATNKRVCDFWMEQYRKDGLAESRAYKNSACLRYRKSLTLYE